MSPSKLILLTNDDGIRSPGLWAAAQALEPLGQVVVIAPRQQWSGAGRSLPSASTGRMDAETPPFPNLTGLAYAIDGTPAQAVQHAVLEILPRLPDLVVSGINYGENVGSGVTVSGTVGAVLEGASYGIPGLAVSLETDLEYNLSYSTDINFSVAAFFTGQFAQRLLQAPRWADVDALKVEVPRQATPHTPWRLTRVSRMRYYQPLKPQRAHFTEAGPVGYRRHIETDRLEPDSDVHALIHGQVAVTPLSLDLTARVNLAELEQRLAQLPLSPEPV